MLSLRSTGRSFDRIDIRGYLNALASNVVSAVSRPAVSGLKRLVVGRPLRSAQLSETLLPKWLALPIFCSDPISSVAYATEEILLVLALGGAAYLALTKWVALGM